MALKCTHKKAKTGEELCAHTAAPSARQCPVLLNQSHQSHNYTVPNYVAKSFLVILWHLQPFSPLVGL
eukprot:3701816-Rhodomonas_salina.1